MSTLLVLTNLPERAAAERLADLLVEKRLAACVNILAPCRSVYRWQGAVRHDEEHPMLIKTTPERYPALEQARRSKSRSPSPTAITCTATGSVSAPRETRACAWARHSFLAASSTRTSFSVKSRLIARKCASASRWRATGAST